MPELPEVETVRRYLAEATSHKVLSAPEIHYPKCVQSPLDDYLAALKGRTICQVDRKGKYLIFRLDDSSLLLFHLRMEGKLFVVPKKEHSLSHLSLFLPFSQEEYGLAFYDVRKFGVTYHLRPGDPSPLDRLGKEPSEIKNATELYRLYHDSHLKIKELLMDQTKMSGLGNIYADEVLFASRISPFRIASTLTEEEVERILLSSQRILKEAIDRNGTTVHTYLSRPDTQGNYQDCLLVYSRTGEICSCCHREKIEARKLSGRTAHYCPTCQKVGISLAVTGKIGSGKSLVTSYFKEAGFVTFSCDEYVHSLYQDKSFLLKLSKEFPVIFGKKGLKKKELSRLLVTDRQFKKRYESLVFSKVKSQVEEFLIREDGKNKAVEVPLLFDAHMESLFTYLVGVETTRQIAHLQERGDKDIEKRIAFNSINSYDKNRSKLDFILTTDGTKEELRQKVDALATQITEDNKQ